LKQIKRISKNPDLCVTHNLKNPRFGRLSAPHLQLVNSGFSNCASLDLEVFRGALNIKIIIDPEHLCCIEFNSCSKFYFIIIKLSAFHFNLMILFITNLVLKRILPQTDDQNSLIPNILRYKNQVIIFTEDNIFTKIILLLRSRINSDLSNQRIVILRTKPIHPINPKTYNLYIIWI
jgi:hypothetical protein